MWPVVEEHRDDTTGLHPNCARILEGWQPSARASATWGWKLTGPRAAPHGWATRVLPNAGTIKGQRKRPSSALATDRRADGFAARKQRRQRSPKV